MARRRKANDPQVEPKVTEAAEEAVSTPTSETTSTPNKRVVTTASGISLTIVRN